MHQICPGERINLRWKPINEETIPLLYKQHIRRDFPPEEHRPLASILELYKKGNYDAYALYEGNSIQGYATLTGSGKAQLVDYLAVIPNARGQGLGCLILKYLQQVCRGILLVEAEDPASTADTAEKQLRQKRIQFYTRNGFQLTKARACVFGVTYCILKRGGEEDAKQLLDQVYREVFPAHIYNSQVTFLEQA